MATTATDHYDVLGVSPTADEVVITAAYRALMRKHHPDLNNGGDSEARAKRINAAYEVLRDPARRAGYDQERLRRAQASSGASAKSAGTSQAGSKTRQSSGSKSSPPPPPPPPPPPRSNAETAQPGRSFDRKVLLWPGIALVLLLLYLGSQPQRPQVKATTDTFVSEQRPLDANIMTADSAMVADNAMVPGGNLAETQSGTPPPLSFDTVKTAAQTFADTLDRTGLLGAVAYSKRCHEQARAEPSWEKIDFCVAFDRAAAQFDAGYVEAAGIRRNSYFAFTQIAPAEAYSALNAMSFVVTERLRQIQAATEPAVYDAVTGNITRRRAAEEAREQKAERDRLSGLVNAASTRPTAVKQALIEEASDEAERRAANERASRLQSQNGRRPTAVEQALDEAMTPPR